MEADQQQSSMREEATNQPKKNDVVKLDYPRKKLTQMSPQMLKYISYVLKSSNTSKKKIRKQTPYLPNLSTKKQTPQ
eukprot:143368-Ditylum_brightwellii.AAC.1